MTEHITAGELRVGDIACRVTGNTRSFEVVSIAFTAKTAIINGKDLASGQPFRIQPRKTVPIIRQLSAR